jgi:hypothetical protein
MRRTTRRKRVPSRRGNSSEVDVHAAPSRGAARPDIAQPPVPGSSSDEGGTFPACPGPQLSRAFGLDVLPHAARTRLPELRRLRGSLCDRPFLPPSRRAQEPTAQSRSLDRRPPRWRTDADVPTIGVTGQPRCRSTTVGGDAALIPVSLCGAVYGTHLGLRLDRAHDRWQVTARRALSSSPGRHGAEPARPCCQSSQSPGRRCFGQVPHGRRPGRRPLPVEPFPSPVAPCTPVAGNSRASPGHIHTPAESERRPSPPGWSYACASPELAPCTGAILLLARTGVLGTHLYPASPPCIAGTSRADVGRASGRRPVVAIPACRLE